MEKLNRMMPLVNEVVSQAAQLITTGGRFLFKETVIFHQRVKEDAHTPHQGLQMLSHTHTRISGPQLVKQL